MINQKEIQKNLTDQYLEDMQKTFEGDMQFLIIAVNEDNYYIKKNMQPMPFVTAIALALKSSMSDNNEKYILDILDCIKKMCIDISQDDLTGMMVASCQHEMGMGK